MSVEKLIGRGMLGRLGSPVLEWSVEYAFTITAPVTKGTIKALDGTVFSEGQYQLVTEDAELYKVRNAGLGQWVITIPEVKKV